MAGVIADVTSVTRGRLNLLATDGEQWVATRWGDTLYVRESARGLLVASEPGAAGADGGWLAVPDRSLAVADTDGIRIVPLAPGPTLEPFVEGNLR